LQNNRNEGIVGSDIRTGTACYFVIARIARVTEVDHGYDRRTSCCIENHLWKLHNYWKNLFQVPLLGSSRGVFSPGDSV